MFSRGELEEALTVYEACGREAAATHDWNPWADQFTEDAVYVEHLFGEFNGREAIRTWITNTMTTFPGARMPVFPIEWHIIDVERGWIVCQIANVMEDPGDGSVYQASNLTVLHYAGDGMWSREEDVYNPARFLTMVSAWCERADELGTLPDDARAWRDAMSGRSS